MKQLYANAHGMWLLFTTTVSCPCATETVAEAHILRGLLRQCTDIRPNMSGSGWSYSADNQFPPLKNILKSTFWQHEYYSPVRDRLLRAAPIIEIEEGSDYYTIHTITERREKPQVSPLFHVTCVWMCNHILCCIIVLWFVFCCQMITQLSVSFIRKCA